MSGRLENRTVLVTGAGSGIGRATVLRAIAEGARVAMIDLEPAGLESTVETARTAGGTVWSACIDITEPGALASTIPALVRDLGPLDGVFANAGILPPPRPVEAFDPAEWDRVVLRTWRPKPARMLSAERWPSNSRHDESEST